MKIIKSLNEIESNKAIGVTIGNFDGVHKGHQQVLSTIKKKCQDNDIILVVITFTPHPLQVLRPSNNYLINSYKERIDLLDSEGVEYLLEIPFTRDLSTLSPGDFLDQYILCSKNILKIFLGHDFCFGSNKSGDFNFVKKHCERTNVEVEVQEKFTAEDEAVSSTYVRKSIESGDLELTNLYLNRNFFISGLIVKGEGRGKKIGFPTANILIEKERIIPCKGVYYSNVEIDGMTFQSITNVGNNPTFNDENKIFVETHILGFDRDIYGEELKVVFIKKIRDEKKFQSVNELVAQITHDVDEAKKYFIND